MLKKILAVLTAVLLVFSLAACGGSGGEDGDPVGDGGDSGQTWAIYWYLCGSNLESLYASGTTDLDEMQEVELPENIKVVIETGGASAWQNDYVDPGVLGRYVYDGEGLRLDEQQPLADMGDPDTLADFLSYCKDKYPADRTMFVFWNHGGGSVSGAAFDENFDDDSLTLSELSEAFGKVYTLSGQNPPFEIVGFDTCLMATVDTAKTFSDIAKYLVASEELEPGGGWLYSGWLQALADNPGMDGAELGRAVCDSFMEGCRNDGVEDEATQSVTNLTKIGPLLDAYDSMGAEALAYALNDAGFFGSFGRKAMSTENYGGNTRNQGYSNMADLGDLAQNCADILPEQSQAVMDCLADCVEYKVSGPYHENATGLSCYFSYNGDVDDLHGFQTEGCSDSFKYLYQYGLEGQLSEEGMNYIGELGYGDEDIQDIPDLDSGDGEETEYPLYLDEEGYATLELDADTVNMLKGIYFELAYVDEEEDVMLLLGQDNDIDADWENGVFKDNFRGVWGAIDEHLVYMEVVYECDDYTTYSVPILLNGEDYNLRVIYDYSDEQFYILGARKDMDDSGMADKNLMQLKPGDEITTIHYAATFSGDDDFEPVELETFEVTENTSFSEIDTGDGTFLMMFELADSKNNTAYSQMIQFTVNGEETEVEILE